MMTLAPFAPTPGQPVPRTSAPMGQMDPRGSLSQPTVMPPAMGPGTEPITQMLRAPLGAPAAPMAPKGPLPGPAQLPGMGRPRGGKSARGPGMYSLR